MAFKIKVTGGGYNIVKSIEKARELIEEYKSCGLYNGMEFLPWYSGSECFK